MDGAVAVVILTALNLEHRAVRRWLSDVNGVEHPAGTVFDVGRLPGVANQAALAVTGDGNTAAAVIAERAIGMFRPHALIFVGVAGALHDDIALGDVVVATRVYAYHGGSTRPGGFRPRPRSWDIPHRLDQIARLVQRQGSWTTALPGARGPAVHFRPIAAGEVVLNSRDDPLYRQLCDTYGDAGAIEMESAGAAHAGQLNSSLPVLTIRGISDRADGGKHDADAQGWQPAAAANAAAFAVAVAAEIAARAGSAGSPTVRTSPARTERNSEAASRRDDLRDETFRWQRAEAAGGEGPDGRATVKPGSGPAPLQLPSPGGPLVGRMSQLSHLDEILLPGGDGRWPRIAVLTGMAGAGKTELALHWAHRAAAAFPDGLLYVDARGFGPDSPLPPEEILAGFLRSLGQSRAADSGGRDERAARFRAAVSGRRMLLLVDNAGSVEQVRPLLPGTASCAVLVTSRARLHGLAVRHTADILDVDRLSPAEAVNLLYTAIGDRATAAPDATRALADQCEGLPLALRIAAEVVASRPRADLSSLVSGLDAAGFVGEPFLDLLDTGDDPYSAIRTVFSWSYRGLADRAATAFRRLGLHPGKSFGLSAAAALLQESGAATRTTLRTLVNAHLLTESSPDRYEMHDLLRAYARDLCMADDLATRRAALERLFEQYLHTADLAGRVIMPYRHRFPVRSELVAADVAERPDGRQSALRWFDRERSNLVGMCRLADTAFDAHRWQLAYVLRDYFYLSKYSDDWLETHRLALAGCERLGDRRGEGITRNNLGRALLEAGRTAEAEAQYRQAHSLLAEAGDDQGVTDSLMNLASVLRRQGKYDEALRRQQAALHAYRRAGLPRKVGITLRGIARTELAAGMLVEAAAHAEEALAGFVELGLHLDTAQTLNTLAEIHRSAGARGRAESAATDAVAHSRLAGSDYEEARGLRMLGTLAVEAGRVAVGRSFWTQAVSIFRRLGAPDADPLDAHLRGSTLTGSAKGGESGECIRSIALSIEEI